MTIVKLFSSTFLNSDEQWSARPTSKLLPHIYHRGNDEGSCRWIAILRNGEQEARIAIGAPVENGEMGCALCVPSWLLQSLGIHGNGDEALLDYFRGDLGIPLTITFEKSEVHPHATRLVFRTLGALPDWLDIREILEEPLSQLGVLRQGQIIPVPAFETIQLLLEVCEPETDSYVFLDGEAALEILTDVDEMPAVAAPAPTPTDGPMPLLQEPFDFNSMVAFPSTSRFIPFQGKGNSLR